MRKGVKIPLLSLGQTISSVSTLIRIFPFGLDREYEQFNTIFIYSTVYRT